ncbi:MAG TPA: hypothetical protein ACFYD7_13355 [Candidatus Wujingus californicus]|uniref:hypothetical protein n=1 Tax=Candidatus Wujingus californicus TaxID=3367618 RepID=UPI004027C15D
MLYQKHILIYFLLAFAFLLHASVSIGHVFDKDTVELYGVGDTDTFTMTDTTGCAAYTEASVADTTIASVSPTSTGPDKLHNKVTPVVVILENRFIAKGTITDIKHAPKGIQKFTMHIKKVEKFRDYPFSGGNYLDKTVEIFSEIGIPSSFQIGIEVSALLRVSVDEWGQYLFLVEVIENEEKD